MGRGGREGTAGMAGGILWGAIWGAVVGGLVLMLAALLLELGASAPPEDRGGDASADRNGVADSAVPRPATGVDEGAATPRGSGAAPAPPDPAPATPAQLAAVGPPADRTGGAVAPGPPRRSLEPRPAMPAMPDLRAPEAASHGAALRADDLPPLPASAPLAPSRAVAAPITGALSPPPGPADAHMPRPDAAARGQAAPAPPVGPAPGRRPARPAPPGPLIAAAGAAPAIAASRPGSDNAPAVPRAAPASVTLRPAPPPRPVPAAAGAAPLPPGPRVAFVLAGDADGPRPAWLRGSASGAGAPDGAPDGADAGPLVLETGGQVFVAPAGVAGYRAARAAGTRALLAYDRLERAADADATALARIARRARRDGAVAVLVGTDPALWARLGAWLDGPARDLVPVDVTRLPR